VWENDLEIGIGGIALKQALDGHNPFLMSVGYFYPTFTTAGTSRPRDASD